MDKKHQYKEAASALRILLNYSQYTKAIGQFKRVRFRDGEYIYNSKTENIIASIRQGSRGWVIRYRPASFYASILEDYAKSLAITTGGKCISLPSFNLSRQQRRIRRLSRNYRPHNRYQVMNMLSITLNKSFMFDGLMMDRREMRRQRRETVEEITIREGGFRLSTDSLMGIDINGFVLDNSMSVIMDELTEVPETGRPQTASPTTNSTGLDEATLRRTLEQLTTSRDPRNPSAE